MFAARGYASTSLESIAERAGVAVQTVYAVFGSKRAVLESLLNNMDDEAGGGDLGPALAGGDPAGQAAAVARFLTRLFTRGADVIGAARAAGAGDPALKALLKKGLARHRQGITRLVGGWSRAKALRPGLPACDAEAILNAITSYEVFQLLRAEGWTAKRYQQWLAATMVTLVLKD